MESVRRVKIGPNSNIPVSKFPFLKVSILLVGLFAVIDRAKSEMPKGGQ